MKKFFLFAAFAVLVMSCAKTEVLNVDNGLTNDPGIRFDVYTQQSLVTKGGTAGDITNDNIWIKDSLGFGVFAYYTAGEPYDVNAKPNFMYNQQVYKESASAEVWKYEPVKYWPNEYGDAAASDEVDYVSFFAYAPWTEFEPTTGAVKVDASLSQAKKDKIQNFNIISVNKNSATGDPIIKYVVDTDPATSVDLLWGVAAPSAAGNYSPIDTNAKKAGKYITAGMPFLNLTKPGNPKEDKLSFNLKHSLAKVKFTIDYIKDDFTPEGVGQDEAHTINADETRIFVRSFTIDGWATQGALNLNNEKAGQPLWKDIDGIKDLNFDEITFNDGRKDNGKEGTENGIQNNELNQYLNPNIIENFCAPETTSDNKIKFGAKKNSGVTNKPQLLFGGDETKNGGYFYVIPRNETGSSVNVKIVYDVETIDPALSGLLSDGMTHGLSIENIISKDKILGPGNDFEAGKQYLVKIHLGMTSVKIEAVVTDWVPTNDEDVDLPDNQPMPCWTVDGFPGYFLEDPSNGIEWSAWDCIYDEATWNSAYANGALKAYLDNNPDEDRWNSQAGRWGWAIDKVEGVWPSYCVQCWKGAINADGAKYPWAVVSLPVPFQGYIKFTYGDQTVYPWGEAEKTFSKGYGIASIPEEFQKDAWLVTETSGLQGDFDPSNLKVVLIPTGNIRYHETIQ